MMKCHFNRVLDKKNYIYKYIYVYIYIYIYIYKHIYICIVGYKQLQFGVYVTPRLMLAQSLGIADLSFFFHVT